MTQLELVLWLDPFGRRYHRERYRKNKRRSAAKRMASKYKCLGQWRDFLRGCV